MYELERFYGTKVGFGFFEVAKYRPCFNSKAQTFVILLASMCWEKWHETLNQKMVSFFVFLFV